MSQDERIFGAERRRRYNRLATIASFLAAALPFALGFVVVSVMYPDGTGPAAIVIALVALAVAPLATWLAHNRLALAGNRGLRDLLERKLREQGEALPEGVEPVFIGFSPGEEHLLWDGDTDRDVGFLAAFGDALVYRGDEYDWFLPRERIDIIEPLQPVAGISRIRIRWHAPRESNRSFTIVSREATDLREARRATHALLQQLYAWVARPSTDGAAPPKLGMPPTEVSGGTPIDRAPGGSCAVMVAVTAATTVAAWQVAGPFVADERYGHAILAAGFVFAVGFAATNIVMRLLMWAEEKDAAEDAA